jgi:SNF2 family DNA or RNA helicase
MEQWYKEIYRISGHKAFIYHGSTKKKIDLGNNELIENFKNARIIITSYNIISISKKNNKNKINEEIFDIKKNKNKNINICILHKIKWDRVIFDEAHHLRNKKTTRFLGGVNIRSVNRWLLSGTPIQNKKADFIHLCYMLAPELMKGKDLAGKEEIVKNIQENYVLKRTKTMVGLEIKAIELIDCKVDWKSIEEKQFAQEIHSLVRATRVEDKYITPFAKQIGLGINMGKTSMLIAMLRAKQSCIMPALMKKTVEWLVDTNKINKKYLIPIQNDEQINNNGSGSGSSKLDKVLEIILEKKGNGRGKLIFCQFHMEMDYLLEKCLENGLKAIIIDGHCIGKQRTLKLETPVDVLILQIQTGCEGLNLQEFYSEVYFVSPHWNPSIEDQAIARCHRMGQKHIVEVYKFEMNGFDSKTISLETYIKGVQEQKRGIRI